MVMSLDESLLLGNDGKKLKDDDCSRRGSKDYTLN